LKLFECVKTAYWWKHRNCDSGTEVPNTPGYLEAMKKKYAHVEQLRFTGYVAEEDGSVIFALKVL